MLAPENHVHEVGEDTARCTNCILKKIEEAMSVFETAIWNWYWTNVTPFAKESGLIPMMIADTGIKGIAKSWLIRGLGMIRDTFEKISAEKTMDKN